MRCSDSRAADGKVASGTSEAEDRDGKRLCIMQTRRILPMQRFTMA